MKQIIIDQNGRTIVRTYTDTEVNLRREVAATLAESNSVVARNIASLKHPTDAGESMCSVRLSNSGTQIWVIELNSIRFLAGIRSREGTVSLNFEADELVELVWVPPPSMRLVLAIAVYPDQKYYWSEKCYFMAIDPSNRAYRLPVANVFDDSSLCTGEYDRRGATSLEVIKLSYEQFRSSSWNADLYSTKKDAFKMNTEKLLRWTATDSGFVQIPDHTCEWPSLCYRIGGDVTDQVLEVLGTVVSAVEPEDEESEEEEDQDEP